MSGLPKPKRPNANEDQVDRTPVARRTKLAKSLKVATSYGEEGEPLGWRPAEGPEDTEGLDIRQVTRGLPKP
jgi:hypothetical protein